MMAGTGKSLLEARDLRVNYGAIAALSGDLFFTL